MNVLDRSYNRVELKGNVGQDPAIRNVNGANVANFTLATTEWYKDKEGKLHERLTWHRIVAWEGKNIPEFHEIKKGTLLIISGKINNGKYTASSGEERPYSEIIALKISIEERKSSE